MALSVCPADFVNAPLSAVWALLERPSSYDSWWDARTERIDPEGPAQAGQTLEATSRAFLLRVHFTIRVESVDAASHALHLEGRFPLGLVVRNHISCSPISPTLTRVQFG